MSENTSDFFEELDTLTAHDPLRKKDVVAHL